MGISNSKPNEKLYFINREVEYIQSCLRAPNKNLTNETKNRFVQTLIKCSTEVNYLNKQVKAKHLNQTKANISKTMEHILSTNQPDQDLDMGAVETSSFVQLPVGKRHMSNKDLSANPGKKPKNSQVDARTYFASMQAIEEKMRTLKPQISVAMENRDTTQLRVHQETIKVLVTDLEMIEVKEHTPLGEKKSKLDKSIVSQYRKIAKAVEEIKDKNINHPRTHNKPTHELELIYQDLHGIEINLSSMLASNDQSTINKLQETMSGIKIRLTSAEITNECARETQMKLLKKHMDISRTINENLKTGSQSDLSKAQVNYEEIVRNIASGDSLDKDEIKVKLHSLQNFINSIKDDDENILRRKQQLLYNVRQSFSLILEDEQKILNTSIVPTHKSNNQELHNFHDNWKSLQKNITPSSLDEYTKIDEVLSDIQNSIEEKRQELAEQTSSVSSLNKNLNNSTPNLSSSKSAGSKFGSNPCVDHTDQSLIKAKVQVYNISTPIQNVGDQPVVLRNKKFYYNSVNPGDSRPFSKIEEIKTQVNYIKEKFHESEQKQHLKNKLESYIEIICGYVYHPNQTIANGAKALLLDIQNMLGNMSHIPQAMNNTSHRRASIELYLENVVGIQTAVEEIEKVVTAFEGYKDDTQYNKIMSELSECKVYLLNVEIPPNYDMIQQQKEEILNKIEVTANNLERKCYYESTELQNTKQILRNLKEKVQRFSGVHKGVLYIQIEKDLTNLLVNVTETIDDKNISEDITKDIEKHLKILEHKATKDQSFRRTISETKSRNEDEEKLISLKNDFLQIKASVDTTPNNAEDLFMNLKSRLGLIKFGLDQLKFTQEEKKHKDILHDEVETLKNDIEAKIYLARQGDKQWPLKQDQEKNNIEELGKIEEKFKTVKPEIESFVGTTSDNKFYELDENSIRLILRMDKLQFERGSEAHNKKIELLKEIYKYGDLLDIRAKEGEDLLDTERSLQDIDNNLARDLMMNDLENLQEKVVNLQTKLHNAQYNNNLLQRKQICIEQTNSLLEKIAGNKEKAAREYAQRKKIEKELSDLLSSMELEFDRVKNGITSFHGTHFDAKYYELNSGLTALFLKSDNIQLPEGSELHSRKIRLLKEMHKYTEVLRNYVKENDTIQEIVKQLNSINIKVDNYNGEDDELKAMENELRSVQIKMENIKIGEDRKKSIDQKFDTLIGEYIRFKQEKETPTNDVSSTSVHKNLQSNLNKNNGPHNLQNSIVARMEEIENEIYLGRKQAGSFMDCESSEEYKVIEDTLLTLTMKLRNVEIGRNPIFTIKKSELEKEIVECLNILDERCSEATSVIEIEYILNKIDDKFKNVIIEEDICSIDEELISLQVKLGKLSVNKDLEKRRNICANRILDYLRQLKEVSDNQSNSAV